MALVSFQGRSDFAPDSALLGLASLLPTLALAGLESERMVLTGSIGFAGAFAGFFATGFVVAGFVAAGFVAGFASTFAATTLLGLVSILLEGLAGFTSALLAGLTAALAVGFPAGRAMGLETGCCVLETVIIFGFTPIFGVGLTDADLASRLNVVFEAALAGLVACAIGLAAVLELRTSLGVGFASFWLLFLEVVLPLDVKLETVLAGFAFCGAAMCFALNVYPSLKSILICGVC